jgi:chromosome segregation ATPase
VKKNRDEQMALTGTEEGEILARLSERVERAVTTIQELRRERDALKTKLAQAETKLTQAEAKLREQGETGERLSSLEEEQARFVRERSEIRSRIETILSSLESLDSAEAK